MLAIPLPIKPIDINNTGPIPPSTANNVTIVFLVPSENELNLSSAFVANSIIGVSASANAWPTGTSVAFNFSIDAWNFTAEDDAVTPSSLSAVIASASVDSFAISRTLDACVPLLATLSKSVEILANWYLPNIVSINLAFAKSSSGSSAFANDITVILKSPAFASTIPLKLIPNSSACLLAAFDGLIKDARPDFKALAASAAPTPPSCIAAIKNAKSFISPPSCLITGATLGIAWVMSSSATTVWFSTAFKKLTVSSNSFPVTLKAFWIAIVASKACSWATPPRTDNLVAWVTTSSSCFPELPAAAASAANLIVSATAIPYFVNSFANSLIFAKAASVSDVAVNISP